MAEGKELGRFSSQIIWGLPLALAFAPCAASAAPPALKKEIDIEKRNYHACLYYSAEAWDDPKEDIRSVARVIIFKCEQSLEGYAAIQARGAVNERAAFLKYSDELRNDIPYAIAVIAEMNVDRQDAAAAKK